MAISEFRFNKKRKHYAYVFKILGQYRKNILFTTKPTRIWKGKVKRNIKLFHHPNAESDKIVYVIPIIYVDCSNCFYPVLLKWSFHKNDKRIIKRLKRGK